MLLPSGGVRVVVGLRLLVGVDGGGVLTLRSLEVSAGGLELGLRRVERLLLRRLVGGGSVALRLGVCEHAGQAGHLGVGSVVGGKGGLRVAVGGLVCALSLLPCGVRGVDGSLCVVGAVISLLAVACLAGTACRNTCYADKSYKKKCNRLSHYATHPGSYDNPSG